jgi:hypothetical protein
MTPEREEEINKAIDAIYGPGKMFDSNMPSRAKNHDQRKGQWLVNKIRMSDKYASRFVDAYDHKNMMSWKALVEQILFNIENDEYDSYMDDYND